MFSDRLCDAAVGGGMKKGQTRVHTQRNDDEEHKYHKARAEIK